MATIAEMATNTLGMFAPLILNMYSIFMIILGVTVLVLIGKFYGLRRMFWDINGAQYYFIEFIHNNRLAGKIMFLQNDKAFKRETREYTYGRGTITIPDFITPIRVGMFGSGMAYRFQNDNVFPSVNVVLDAKGTIEEIKYKPIDSLDVLTKPKVESGKPVKFLLITSYWFKKQFEENFVEKIKKEKKDGWAAFIEFLKSPSGAIICLGLMGLIGFAIYMSR